MEEFWQNFVGSLLAGGALISVLIWLSKRIILVWLDKALESHKAKLEAANNRAADELRHHFQILAQEHNVRFSLLYERRAEVLTRLYYLAYHMHLAWRQLWKQIANHDIDEYKWLKETFGSKATEFLQFFQENRIILPDEIKTTIDVFAQTYLSTEKESIPSKGSHRDIDGKFDSESWKRAMEEWHSQHHGALLTGLERALSTALDPASNFKSKLARTTEEL